MFDALSLTQGLAALIGLYFLAAGIGLLTDSDGISKMLTDLKEQPLLGYLAAVMAFAIGGAMVAVHNDWSTWLSAFVSLIGWIALAEGVLLLAARQKFIGAVEGLYSSESFLKGMSVAVLIAGVVLLWCAFS
ncbi:MAG: hypothetical protein K0U34_05165 [Alphaproteobacteria bacterium]|nr:hypothetical protein [Alphaproteobacteria bacterium]